MRIKRKAWEALMSGGWTWPSEVVRTDDLVDTAPRDPSTVRLYMDLTVMDKGRGAFLKRIKMMEVVDEPTE